MRSKRPDDPLCIVLDENIASEALRDALTPHAVKHGATVELLHQYVPRGTKDEAWLPAAGARGWVVITVDVHVRLRPAEREILSSAGVIAFILRGRALDGNGIRDALAAALPSICRHARKLRPPVIGHVRADGTVVVIEGERRAATKRD